MRGYVLECVLCECWDRERAEDLRTEREPRHRPEWLSRAEGQGRFRSLVLGRQGSQRSWPSASAQASPGWRGQRPLAHTSAGDEEAGPPGRCLHSPTPLPLSPTHPVLPGQLPRSAPRETGAAGGLAPGCTNLGLPIWTLPRGRTGRRRACSGRKGRGTEPLLSRKRPQKSLRNRLEPVPPRPPPRSQSCHSPRPQRPLPTLVLATCAHTAERRPQPPAAPLPAEHAPRCRLWARGSTSLTR